MSDLSSNHFSENSLTPIIKQINLIFSIFLPCSPPVNSFLWEIILSVSPIYKTWQLP